MRKDRGNSFRGSGHQQKRDSSKDLCYNYKKSGHYITDCTKPLRDKLKKDKKKDYPKKDKKSFKKYHNKNKGQVVEGFRSQSESESDSDSSDDEGPEVDYLTLTPLILT